MRITYPLMLLGVLCTAPTLTHAIRVNTPVVSVDTYPGDSWYGPGYYYGEWYDDEDAYWEWRREHPDYPANKRYYNRHHRVYYRGDR